MQKAILGMGLFILASVQTQAALSPYYDSAEQMCTLLQDPAVAHELEKLTHSSPLTSVVVKGALTYEITAGNCKVVVTLERILPQVLGKTSYRVASCTKAVCSPLLSPAP